MSFGGPEAPPPINPSKEYSKILDVFQQKELPAFQSFVGSQPLINAQQQLAAGQVGQLPGLEKLLTSAYGAGTGNIPMAEQWIKTNYLGRTPTPQLTGPLMQTYQNQLQPILRSGG